MKTWEIYHYTYQDVCGDSYYGKQGSYKTIGFVTDSEDNVKALVAKLNTINQSYFEREPYNGWDEDYEDEDYIAYEELKISTIEEIESRCSHKYDL